MYAGRPWPEGFDPDPDKIALPWDPPGFGEPEPDDDEPYDPAEYGD